MWQYICRVCGYVIEWLPYASWSHINRNLDEDHYPQPYPIEGTDAWRRWKAQGILDKEDLDDS